MKKNERLLLILLTAALSFGIAQAKHGADDPPGDDRRASSQERGRGADDTVPDDRGGTNCQTPQANANPQAAAAKCSDDGAKHTRLNTPGNFFARHGADDPPGDDHGGHGHDDGPAHA